MKIQTAVPTASIYFDLMKRFADRVNTMSNGRIKMEVLPDGAVVNAFEILDAVDKGVVDGGYAWTHYWSGKNSAAALFSNPAAGAGTGMDQMSHVSWLYQGGGNALYEKLYEQGLKVNVKVGDLVLPMVILGAAVVVIAVAMRLNNVVTYALAILLMGRTHAQCLGLMHESVHRLLMRNKAVNDFFGRWLLGYPAFTNTDGYRIVRM
mgnify:CR=1 FL=1